MHELDQRNYRIIVWALAFVVLSVVGLTWMRPRIASKSANDASQAPHGLKILCWNIESDGNDPSVISQQLLELGTYDIYALQEVHSANHIQYITALQEALGEQYRHIVSHTGHNDRLMIAFDSNRLSLLSKQELFEFAGTRLNDWRHRSPLVAHFRDEQSGREFLFLTVHLARGSAEFRAEQSKGLREWASAQTLPIVAIGDFNMDYHFETEKGNEAFDLFLAGDVWQWVRPEEWIDTNYFDGDGDGQDDFPGSMLDFAFVAGSARGWNGSCRTIVRPGDFPDDASTADHRPVELLIE